jgi:peptidoglycan/xylan/chitin deacetylase (PgdA/CDA1 family)
MTAGSARQTIKAVWRSARMRVGGAAAVLIYHRISSMESDPELLALSPERFDEQVAALSRDFNVVPVDEVFRLLDRPGRMPKRTVAITFDDGYADALHSAVPILHAHGVPGTLFLSSGAVDSPDEYWWDQLEQICFAPAELPPTITIDTGARTFSHSLGKDAIYPPETAMRDASWNVTQPTPGGRQRLYLELASFMRQLPPAERNPAMASLLKQTGAAPTTRTSHRTLDAAEVALLSRDPLIGLGGHTIDHAVLSACSTEEQRHQIHDDKLRLEQLCERRLTSFSYPHGGFDDFNAESRRLVQAAGYEGACTTDSDICVAWGDRFRVPRYLPRDMSADDLSAKLARWLDEGR